MTRTYTIILLLGSILLLGACQDDEPRQATTAEVRAAVSQAIRDDTLGKVRLENGQPPTTMAEFDRATLPAAQGQLAQDYEQALEDDAREAGAAFGHPVDQRVKDALMIGMFNALLRHGLLEPGDPGGIPTQCVETDPDTGEKRIIPALHDGDPDTGDQDAHNRFESWRVSVAPSGLGTRTIMAFEDGARTERDAG